MGRAPGIKVINLRTKADRKMIFLPIAGAVLAALPVLLVASRLLKVKPQALDFLWVIWGCVSVFFVLMAYAEYKMS